MPDEVYSEDDRCKCGHIRSEHNEFVNPGCSYITCFCRKFERMDLKTELLEGEDSESEREYPIQESN